MKTLSVKLGSRQLEILLFLFFIKKSVSCSELQELIEDVPLRNVWRMLQDLCKVGYVIKEGTRRNYRYSLTRAGKLAMLEKVVKIG